MADITQAEHRRLTVLIRWDLCQ